MKSRDHIQDEGLGSDNGLPPAAGNQAYTVPEGYFEGLAASVMAKIKLGTETAAVEIAALSPLLAGMSRVMPYSLPEGYFQETLEEIPYLIQEDPDSAILSLVERVTPYEVPQGYFFNLPGEILEKVSVSRTRLTPVVRRRWMRMAVAALVIGLISLGGILYFTGKHNGFDASKPLAQQLKNVSTPELTEFIRAADVSATSSETAKGRSSNKGEVKQLLNDVSDNEVDAFLKQVPSEDEDLSLIN
ncbi:MAG: hypothetical protein ACXVMS_14375 [Flavisolibacter sp.]